MLDGAREIYEENARTYVHDWESMNKNDIVREAVDMRERGVNYDGHISAIMLKYWNKINTYYSKCKLCVTPEDIHTWLVQSVMYAIENHPWTRIDSSIYNDVNGPDKVINRVMESKRLTFYQQLNRNNRKINGGIMSLDSLVDEYSDAVVPSYTYQSDMFVKEVVIKMFNRKDYFYAFLVDAVAYEGIPVSEKKKLATHLLSIDDIQCEIVSNRYDIAYDKVKKAASYVIRMKREAVNERIAEISLNLKNRVYM